MKAGYILEIEYTLEHITIFSINIWGGNLTKENKLRANQFNDNYTFSIVKIFFFYLSKVRRKEMT